ncbi:hypothetical protein OHA71_06715 [Streptomyces sp. NBC_00444]|uniref:hypothetical protein n=1 Tax=Streptomyces sp. NBC_00444 TaxID=2975744 RepID=UPI002E21EF43
MTTETTQQAEQTGVSLQRKNYMAALSLAERLMSETPVMPTEIVVHVSQWASGTPEIRVYFHRDAAALRTFADWQWMDVVTTEQENGSIRVAAKGGLSLEGVRVTAHTLLPAASSETADSAVAA